MNVSLQFICLHVSYFEYEIQYPQPYASRNNNKLKK